MKNKGLLSIHIAVLLLGGSSFFVKLIPMSALLLTLGRAFFSMTVLYIYMRIEHKQLKLHRLRDYFWNLLAGLLLTIHWFFFIMSVQVSKVSIGTIVFATYPMFVMFIEPYFFKEKFQYKNFISVIMISIGIAFLIPAFEITNSVTLGIIYGLISSLSFALLSTINRRLVSIYESVTVTFYEQTVAALVMTIIISIMQPDLGQGNTLHFFELIIYGVIFTALAHSLYIHGLTNVKAQTASIISVLEPVYSVFLAILFLGERLVYQEVVGIVFILFAVVFTTLMNKKGSVDIYEE